MIDRTYRLTEKDVEAIWYLRRSDWVSSAYRLFGKECVDNLVARGYLERFKRPRMGDVACCVVSREAARAIRRG